MTNGMDEWTEELRDGQIHQIGSVMKDGPWDIPMAVLKKN